MVNFDLLNVEFSYSLF